MVECYACKTEITNGSLIENRILCQKCSDNRSKCSNCSKYWYFSHLEKCIDCNHVFDRIVCTFCKKPSLLGLAYKPGYFKCDECYGKDKFNKIYPKCKKELINSLGLCSKCKTGNIYFFGIGGGQHVRCDNQNCDYIDDDFW